MDDGKPTKKYTPANPLDQFTTEELALELEKRKQRAIAIAMAALDNCTFDEAKTALIGCKHKLTFTTSR